MDGERESHGSEYKNIISPHEEIWLLGQPPLTDYLHFVRHIAVDGENADQRALADEWREANDYYHELEELEAGIADHVECGALDPAMAPLAEELMADSGFRNAFDTLPTTIGLVELDRLVIFQPHVTCRFTDALRARLMPKPGPEALFRFCLPLGRPDAPVEIQRVGSRRFIFWSESSDFRFLDPVLLKPEQVRDPDSNGSIAAIVGLTVGFGSNLLNVVRDDNRMVLHNGYHRAYALRAAGITHAPCVIQTVTRLDELYVAGAKDVVKNPAFYFKAARPPLLKDFFDPRIRKIIRTRRVRKMVEVSFEINDFEVAD
jgi:hypothetical protein